MRVDTELSRPVGTDARPLKPAQVGREAGGGLCGRDVKPLKSVRAEVKPAQPVRVDTELSRPVGTDARPPKSVQVARSRHSLCGWTRSCRGLWGRMPGR
ncbi:hypothetical protein GCM10020219_099060 [Nonomuraea dietziae]